MSERAAAACPGRLSHPNLSSVDRPLNPCLPIDASNAQRGAREPQLRPPEPPELRPPGCPPGKSPGEVPAGLLRTQKSGRNAARGARILARPLLCQAPHLSGGKNCYLYRSLILPQVVGTTAICDSVPKAFVVGKSIPNIYVASPNVPGQFVPKAVSEFGFREG